MNGTKAIVSGHSRGLGAGEQRRLDHADAQRRAHLSRPKALRITERIERTARRIQRTGVERALTGQAALARLFGGIDCLQVGP